MYKKVIDNFEIEYNDSDLEYIEPVINSLLSDGKEILNFFKFDQLDKKVKIKYFDNTLEYRECIKEKLFNGERETSPWDTGRAINKKGAGESFIYMLSYKERIKIKGHELDTIEGMERLMIHEFTHICHNQFKDYKPSLIWFSEGLATMLAKNSEYDKNIIDCSFESLVGNNKVPYHNYHGITKYIFENYDNDYILKLAKDPEFLTIETEKLYYEAKDWYNNILKK